MSIQVHNSRNIITSIVINQIILLITIILYVTIYLGMILQILLGGIQIISALILFRYWKQIPQKIKEYLNIYWVITIVYGICWLFNWDSFNETFIIVFGVMCKLELADKTLAPTVVCIALA